jgi:pimeloyl-ACP methyl ester carboxylesterase
VHAISIHGPARSMSDKNSIPTGRLPPEIRKHNVKFGVSPPCVAHPRVHGNDGTTSETYLLCMIPGNPGFIEYYDEFLMDLATNLEQSKTAVEGVRYVLFGAAHSGFVTKVWNPEGLKGKWKTPYSLDQVIEAQIDDLQDFIEEQEGLREPVKVVLIGHSVGSYISLEMTRRLRERGMQDKIRVVGGLLLFPTVVDIAKSPHGIKLSVRFDHFLCAINISFATTSQAWHSMLFSSYQVLLQIDGSVSVLAITLPCRHAKFNLLTVLHVSLVVISLVTSPLLTTQDSFTNIQKQLLAHLPLLTILTFLAQILTIIIPPPLHLKIVKSVTRMTQAAAQVTSEFTRTPSAIRQALGMGKEEMQAITHDRWDTHIWGEATGMRKKGEYTAPRWIFYWGHDVSRLCPRHKMML